MDSNDTQEVRMKVPDGMKNFSIGGMVKAIENGFVKVERWLVDEARAHGLMLADDQVKPVEAHTAEEAPKEATASDAGASTGEPKPGASTAAAEAAKPAA